MITKINSTLRRDEGFSLIELLIVVAIIGIIAAIAIPQLMNAMDRGRQRRSMADMRSIGTANGTMRVDTGQYETANLANLVPTYLQVPPLNDGWGTAFVLAAVGADGYSVTSLGSDAAGGPAPPATWINEPYDPDIIFTSGQFTQAPSGQ